MTPREALRIIAAGDRLTGGGLWPWPGMQGWDEKSCRRYVHARQVYAEWRRTSALRSGKIRARLTPGERALAAEVADRECLDLRERRELSLYLRGRRICLRFDALCSAATSEAARNFERAARVRGGLR